MKDAPGSRQCSRPLAKPAALLAAAIPLLLSGCRFPEPRDLALAADTSPPPSEEARVLAGSIDHPILRPIQLDDRDGLSADEAAILAVVSNPLLRAARSRRRIAEAQVIQAGILPNPEFSFGLQFPVGEQPTNLEVGYGFGLSWEVTSLLQLSARKDAAQSHASSVDLEIAWQEWQVSQAAKMHLLRLVLLREEVALAAAAAENHRGNVDVVRRALELGGKSAQELAAAEAALVQASAAHLSLEQEERTERLALNRALGLPPEAAVKLQNGVAVDAAPPPSSEEVLDGIEGRRLDLLALRQGYESQEHKLRAAVRGSFPRIRLGLLRGREPDKVEALAVGVGVDLPIFDRNQGSIAFEEASRDVLFEEYRFRLFEARHQTARILSDMEIAGRRLRLEESALPPLRRLVEALDVALRQGSIAAPDYYQARRDLSMKELDVLRLRRALSDLRIALEITAGRYFQAPTGVTRR